MTPEMDEKETEWPKDYWALAQFLGARKSTIENAKRSCGSELVEGVDFIRSSGRPTQAFINFNESGAIKIAEHVRTSEAADFLESKGLKRKHAVKDENYYLGIVIAATKGFTRLHKQYGVDGYKIDLYMPEIRLAIECDERGHQGYYEADDRDREVYIKNKMACDFLRFNPNDPFFNIGTVINVVFSRIFAKKEDENRLRHE